MAKRVKVTPTDGTFRKPVNDGMDKTFPRARQTTIPGTADEQPPEVMAAAEKYLEPKRKIAGLREKMNAGKEELIEAMHAAGVTEILIDDGEKRLKLLEKDSIQIEARKKKDSNDRP